MRLRERYGDVDWGRIGLWVVIVVAVVGVVVGFWWNAATINDLRGVVEDRQERLDSISDQYRELYTQAEQEGVRPQTKTPEEVEADVPDPIPGPQGERGERGPRGIPGDAGTVGPQGPAGEDGQDGAQGTPGAPGEPGSDGARGEPGSAGERGPQGEPGPQGERGPAGPQGERGPAGEQGPPGTDGRSGEDGRTITGIVCQLNGAWLLTYSDNTTSTAAGPCISPNNNQEIPQ